MQWNIIQPLKMIDVIIWIGLGNMPSERRQLQMTTYHLISFVGNAWDRQFHRNTKYISGCLGLWGLGTNEKLLLMIRGFFFR